MNLHKYARMVVKSSHVFSLVFAWRHGQTTTPALVCFAHALPPQAFRVRGAVGAVVFPFVDNSDAAATLGHRFRTTA